MDPHKTNQAIVIEYSGKYHLFNPPAGGRFELTPNRELGSYDAVCVDPEGVAKNYNDVSEDMLAAKIFTGEMLKRYAKMSGKEPVNPFEVQEVLLENLDRQAEVLRKERDMARREAAEFKQKAHEEALATAGEKDKIIAKLQDELRKAQSTKGPVLK